MIHDLSTSMYIVLYFVLLFDPGLTTVCFNLRTTYCIASVFYYSEVGLGGQGLTDATFDEKLIVIAASH